MCSLLPTSGAPDNQQMVYAPPFTDRLDAALAMNGLDNATFASHFGKDPQGGQSIVNRWRSRNRVGGKSLPRVRELLPKTSMEWLQEGIGEPERFRASAERSHINDVRQSYVTRLDPRILAQAVRVVSADEHVNGQYPPLKHAILLLETCDRLEAGERVTDMIARFFDDEQGHGDNGKNTD